jgi:hypothetical protein
MSGPPSEAGAIGPGTELDGFVIEAVAGRGGMGVVYRARQRRPDRAVALKVITADLADATAFRARFQREATIAAQIEHPNVIPVYAVGEAAGGVLYIAMRFVDGVDLRSLLAAEGRLEPGRAAAIVAQVGQALDAAHAHGLVHRDVKPANILVSRIGGGGGEHVYLSDFGISRHIDGSQALTGTGAFLGTIDYVAPEQARGERVDARTDVYSLGCVLFHAITGTVPFPLENDLAKLYAHDTHPPPSALERARGIPPAFEGVLARAMAKAPDDRFQSAGDLGRAALAATGDAPPPRAEHVVGVGRAAPPDATLAAPTALAEPRGSGRRGRAPLVVAGVAVAALAAGLAVVLGSGSSPKPPSTGGQTTTTTAAVNPTLRVASAWLAAFNAGDDALVERYTQPGVVVNVTQTSYRRLATPAVIRLYLSRRHCALTPVAGPTISGSAAYVTATVRAGTRRGQDPQACASTGTLAVTLVVRGDQVTQVLSGPIQATTPAGPPASVAPYSPPS